MNTKILFAITSSLSLALLLFYINQPTDLVSMAMLMWVSTTSCLIYFLCNKYLTGIYFKKIKENSLIESLFQFLYYSSRGNTSLKSLSYIIKNSRVNEIKKGFENVSRQIKFGRPTIQALEALFARYSIPVNLNPSEGGGFQNSLRKFLSLYSKNKNRDSSLILDSLQRNSTINMFLSTLLPSFLLFIFVGTSVISPSNTGLLFISLMMLIVVPSIYAISSTIFSRRLIAEIV